jgi:glycosyltransferase involved in cell wall biosynthesis
LYTPPVLRVLQVVLSLHPGGTERLVLELARRLRGRVDTAICCLDEAGTWGEAIAAEGVSVTALGRQPGFHPRLGVRVANVASRHRADVVHCHHYSPFVYASVWRLLYGGRRLIFTEHGRLADAPPSRKRRAANTLLAKVPDRVFTVSEDLRRHLVREGFPPGRVGVIYNGIDVLPPAGAEARARARAAFGFTPEECVLVTVARLDPVKDLGTLIDAAARVRRAVPRVRVLVVGEGDERRRLEELTAARDLRDRVVFAGHRDDARALLAGADIFVNSSTFEGVSLTILEAMAASLPVVATAVGGTPEVVTGEAGMLVPARDGAALAAAIEQLASDPRRRETLGAGGRRRVEETFTLDRMVNDYDDLYRGER